MYSYNPYYEKYLAHFGVKHKSGRYPWGSGERPYQGDGAKFGLFSRKKNKKVNDTQNKTNEKVSNTEKNVKLDNGSNIKIHCDDENSTNIVNKITNKINGINEVMVDSISENQYSDNYHSYLKDNSNGYDDFRSKLSKSLNSISVSKIGDKYIAEASYTPDNKEEFTVEFDPVSGKIYRIGYND